jgi:hypothetical protein
MENGWKPSKRYLTAYKGLYGAQLELGEAKYLARQKAASRPRGCPDEDYEHMACVNWLGRMGLRCHHSPNGGKRDWHTGAKLKAMGTSAGFPDLFLPYARKGYHGLFCEVKALDGHVSQVQREWLALLTAEGYYAFVAYGAAEFIRLTEKYFKEDTDG